MNLIMRSDNCNKIHFNSAYTKVQNNAVSLTPLHIVKKNSKGKICPLGIFPLRCKQRSSEDYCWIMYPQFFIMNCICLIKWFTD